MWRAIAPAFIAALASTAGAQTVVTRSGEHDSFSRLVMRLPDGVAWSLNQSGQSASLSVDAPAIVFDTSSVFNLIPRTRLQAVTQAGPGQPLQLQLGCECEISTFIEDDGFLVVDIRDGEGGAPRQLTGATLPTSLPLIPGGLGAASGSGYRFNLAARAAADARTALDLAGVISGRTPTQTIQIAASSVETPAVTQPDPAEQAALSREIRLPVSGSTSTGLNLSSVTLADPKPERSAQQVAAATEVTPAREPQKLEEEPVAVEVNSDLLLDLAENERAATVNASEQRLLQQIGRATNQGLLDLVGMNARDGGRIIDPLGLADRPLDPLDQVAVTSSVDRESGLSARRAPTSSEASHCMPSYQVAVHNWGSDASFNEQIPPLRAALVREFDDVDPVAVLRLARAYVYFGFGAEAQAILNMMPSGAVEHDDAMALAAMAAVLDGKEMDVNHAFAGQQVCNSDVAFWAALADGTIKKSAKTDAIQQAFAKMPPHLRIQVGPRLSKLFAQAGDPHLAGAALRSLDRMGVEDIPDINLAEAELAKLEGDIETVAEELTEEVAERTENAPRALIELIELSYDERKALSPDVPDLAASYEVESRDSELGADLREAIVTALALTGQYHDSFAQLDKVDRHDGDAARATAMIPLMTLLTERADDVTFLQYALVFAANGKAADVEPVADLVAARLLDLGFAQQAQALLKKLAMEPGNTKRRLMLAKAALVQEKPHAALVELMGLSGSDADKLRAEALWQNGEYARAGEYLLEVEDKDAAARGFWHSQDGETLSEIDPDAAQQFGGVAEVTTQIKETAKEPTGLPPLAHARALVESSEGTRGGIADLLERVTRQNEVGNGS
ncbi:tetratricopeptide repeat protein [Phaeobacter italicus]|uniref:tetratricopeptide repeat protein n=1 Tax=Phaeobacter italicus TaxID=481446 RepID=UPI00242EFA20|nr:hypothetical protein [Phaeobacter italicus]MCI5100786.1 hypothetical protein [Phaeobacter italicus]